MQPLKTTTSMNGRGGVLGTLRDDLAEIARKVHDALSSFDIIVWTDSDAQIYFECVDRAPSVPAGFVAGTYGVGSIPGDIESDLCVLRTERVPTSMLCN